MHNYKQFFDDNPVPMFIYDPRDMSILAVNTAATISYGYQENEFLTKTIYDLRPVEDAQILKDKVAELEITGFTDAGQWRHVKKNGEIFNVHIFSNSTVFEGKKARLSLAYDITKRIKVEQENETLNELVKQQKDELDQILSSIDEVVWSRRISDGRLVYINKACLDIYGFTPEEMTKDGGLYLEHIHPEDLPGVEEKVRENYLHGHSYHEYRIIHRDGAIKYVRTEATVRRDDTGTPIFYTGITIDITRQRLAELALKRKILEIEDVFESITDSFISIDRDWNITYVNKQFEALVKKEREVLLGKNFWECFPKIVESRYYNDYLKSMNDRVVMHSAGPSPSTGKILSVFFYPTETGIAVYFKDITEETNLNDELINKERKLSAVINNTKDIIWSVDKDWNLMSANDAYYNRLALLTGNKSHNDIGVGDFAKERVEKWAKYFNRVLGGETFKVVEEDTVGGKTVFEEISFNPILDSNNNIVGASCFSRNITEHVEQLKMIKEQNEKLKNIAWIQSHKVRGPVATILGLVALFDNDDQYSVSNKEIVDGIRDTAQQLDTVIREVVKNTIIENK